jgi:flagellar biosynthesis protein FlhA
MLTIQRLARHNDVLLAIGVVLVVSMLILPLPAMLLDGLITINIALAIMILLVALATREPLQYSTFPTVLLISTLFRLGLNVSSTRLILTGADAGNVIQSFGTFVIGGNYVVGLLIFIILMIINFIVITNGAGRVSEVAARFTLDALPGKQLSIDADLNAGLINEEQAKKRRVTIQKEADFHGTMDGASKFVKGDAIAGIIITLINIIGGLIIGVLQLGMPVAEAASRFTILSVGDGLVSSLPALIISTATGILVTRVSTDDTSLGDDIGTQMFMDPKVLGILGGLLIVLGCIPGMPNLPFLIIGAISGTMSYLTWQEADKAKQRAQEAETVKALPAKKPTNSTESVLELLKVESLELEIGYRLVPLIEPEAGGDLLERIGHIRRQVATEMGLVLPSIRVRDNLQLQPNHYVVKLRGVPIGEGEIMADMWMAMGGDPAFSDPLSTGIETKEPAFGLPAWWIETEERDAAEAAGYTVVNPSAVVATHLTQLMKRHSYQILSRSDVQTLLDNIKASNPSLVEDLIPDNLSVSELHIILQHLLQEQVSIRDMASILEALSYHYRVSKDLDFLTEQARMALSRSICKQHLDPGTSKLPVLTLSPDIEEVMAQSILPGNGEPGTGGASLAMNPQLTQRLLAALNSEVERAILAHGMHPVLLCNARIRLPFRRLLERVLPQVAILSYNEVGPSVAVQALGAVRLDGV